MLTNFIIRDFYNTKTVTNMKDTMSDNGSVASNEEADSCYASSEKHGSGSSSTAPHNDNSVNEEKRVEKLINRENKEVGLWRFVVTMMLLVTASLVTYFTHEVLVENDQKDFENGVSEDCTNTCSQNNVTRVVKCWILDIVCQTSHKIHLSAFVVQGDGYCYVGLCA
jgi:hypothetical protein